MGRAKEIIVKVIHSKVANDFVKKHHYSGKVVQNSALHFGCFLDNNLHGVLSYGSPIDKSKVLSLVKPSLWNEMLELNRMAFNEYLPKFSESRCLAISIKLIKKNAPHIKWILSFADGTQCGDGTIYRASGFFLTAIRDNKDLIKLPNGFIFHELNSRDGGSIIQKKRNSDGYTNTTKWLNDKFKGWERLNGFQLRYIYLIDKTCKITVPILPFSKIDALGAGMYKGKKITLAERQITGAGSVTAAQQATSLQEGFESTSALKNTGNAI